MPPAGAIPGYHVLRVLGQGGFSKVWLGEASNGGAPAAIKVAPPGEAGARLLAEAEVMRQVGARIVPEVFASASLAAGGAYVAMELIKGPCVAELLERQEGMAELPELSRRAFAILAAVEQMHARGFAHLDLKPENIFLPPGRPTAVLIDLGLALPISAPACALGPSELILGTPEYMAPEQLRGERPGAPADVYAAGVLIYELLTGRTPFYGNEADIREGHLSRRPPRPSTFGPVPDALDEVILQAIAKSPRDRFLDVPRFRHALEGALITRAAGTTKARSLPPRPDSPPPKGTAPTSRRAAIVFFESSFPPDRVKDNAEELGGQVASVQGVRFAVVLRRTGAHPVEAALRLANELVQRGIAARARVDSAVLRERARSDGSVTYVSMLFGRSDRYPPGTDPFGVSITPAAQQALGAVKLIETSDGTSTLLSAVREAGPFLGREAELEAGYESACLSLRQQMPTVFSAFAESGLGKTVFLNALLALVSKSFPAAALLRLRPHAATSQQTTQGLADLVRGALSLPTDATPEQVRSVLETHGSGQEVEHLIAPLCLALGATTIEAAGLAKLQAAPGALSLALVRATAELLRLLAKQIGLVVALDDAQLADDQLLDALELAALAEASAPIWVGIAADPRFMEARPTWGRRASARSQVSLLPLDPNAAEELCRALLRPAQSVPTAVVRTILEKVHGSPLLLVELVRDLKRRGLVQEHPSAGWVVAAEVLSAAPDAVALEWLAERQIEALPEDLKLHARLLATLSDEVGVAEHAGILRVLEDFDLGQTFPLDGAAATAQLANEQILVPLGDRTYVFRHGVFRAQLRAGLAPETQKLIHQAALAYYQRDLHLDSTTRELRLAFHADGANERQLAATTYAKLGDHMRAHHAYLKANLMYQRAIELLTGERDALLLECYRGRALVRSRLGRYHEALEDLKVARGLADEAADQRSKLLVLLDTTMVLDWMSDYQQARETLSLVRELPRGEADSPIELWRTLSRARDHVRFSENAAALPLLEAIIAKHAPEGEAYEPVTIAMLLLATTRAFAGELDASEPLFARVIECCERHEDWVHVAASLNNRAQFLWAMRGDLERAAADHLRLVSIGVELGQVTLEYVAAFNLAELYYYWGDFAKAESQARRALATERWASAKPLAELLLARIHLFSGCPADASRRVEPLLKGLGAEQTLWVPQDEVLLRMVHLGAQTHDGPAWLSLHEAARRYSLSWERAEALEAEALALTNSGNLEAACEKLEAAILLFGASTHLICHRLAAHNASLVQRASSGAPGNLQP